MAKSRKRGKKGLMEPLSEWWESKRDSHLSLLGAGFVLGVALMLWAFLFFLFLTSNAQQEANEWARWTTHTWIGTFIGMILLIFVAPEFFHYLGHYNNLQELLESDSRAEFQQFKGEAEDAVKLLGSVWRARLEAKRVELGIRRSMPSGMEVPETSEAGWITEWVNTDSSRLAERFPDNEALRNPSINRTIAAFASIGLIAFLWNAIFGLARHTEEASRNMSVDFAAWAQGAEHHSTWSPHLDIISALILVIFGLLLYMTGPAQQLAPQDEEE